MPGLQAGSNSNTYALIIGGVNYTTWTDATSISWSDSGAETPAQFECVIASGEVSGKTIAAGYDFTGLEVSLADLANNRKLFGGYVDDMEMEHGPGPVVFYRLSGVSFDALLDRQSIVRWRSAVDLSATRVRWMATDKEMVQSLVSQYGYDLVAGGNVASTNSNMPKLTLKSVTLRDALQAVAEAASQASASTELRRFYVDVNKNVHYFKTNEGSQAPYKVGDRLYDGTYIIPDYIKYAKNVADAAKKVYIKGSNKNGTGLVIKSTGRPYDRVDIIDIPESDSTAARNAMGAAYLNREGAPVRGGRFTVTGYDGWRAGHSVTVRDSAFGLNETFQIREIEANPNLGAGVTTYNISYGALPFRGTDMLPRKKRANAATGRGGGGGGGGQSSDTGSDGSGSGSDTNCFVAGTMIDTPNGAKAIEELRVGDAVLAVDVSDMSLVPSVVTATKHTPRHPERRVRVSLTDGRVFTCTQMHRFWNPVRGDFYPISTFEAGYLLHDAELGAVEIESMKWQSWPVDVFNLTVQTYQNYLVDGLLVHNAKPIVLP